MGQEPSQTALEVALACKPNYVILAEEVRAKNMSLHDVVKDIADMVQARAQRGMHYGTVIIPEGLIESIPEFHMLIRELEDAFDAAAGPTGGGRKQSREQLSAGLTVWSRALLLSLPEYIQSELLFHRCVSVNKVQLSQAETERVLAHFVDQELSFRKKKGTYKGTFSVVCSFIGYQSRGAAPTNFDRAYAYNLGHAAVALAAEGTRMCGYVATVNNLRGGLGGWEVSAVPITALLETGGHRSLRTRAEVPTSEVNLNRSVCARCYC
jgi:pyrophosphate--fructose-6-phosphate 1-phosphotransferase